MVESYLRPLLNRGADTLVLGCTHYPFVLPLIAQVAGPSVTVIDPADAVARELRRRLEQSGLLNATPQAGTIRFWSSGPPGDLRDVIGRVGMDAAAVESLPV
jgi:glutamate racemase